MAKSPLFKNGIPLLEAYGKPLFGTGGTSETDCCCDCSAEYIHCCPSYLVFAPTFDIRSPTGSPIIGDREVTFTHTPLIVGSPGTPIDSVNMSIGERLVGSKVFTYRSGWDIWDVLYSDLHKLMLDIHNTTTPYTPFEVEVKFRFVGGTSGGIKVYAEDLQIVTPTNPEPSTLVLPFDEFSDPDGDWTIAGSGLDAELTSVISSCTTEKRIIYKFSANTDRVTQNRDPCDVGPRFKGASDCYHRTQLVDRTTGGTLGGSVISDCVADSDCECGCQETTLICTCDSTPGAWNQQSHGEVLQYKTGSDVPDWSTNKSVIEFDFLPHVTGWRNEMFFAAWEECGIQFALEIYRDGSFANNVFAKLYYNTTVPSVSSMTVTATSPTDFTWDGSGWNTIKVTVDVTGDVFSIQCNGGTVKSTTISAASAFSSLFSPDEASLGGEPYKDSSNYQNSLGCYDNFSVTNT